MDLYYYRQKIDRFADENYSDAAREAEVVFLGDSLTDFCPLDLYYPEWKTLNRGIAGDTTEGLLHRMQVSVYDLRPKVVVLLIGGNNLQTMFVDYEEILKGIGSALPDTKVVLVSLTPMGEPYAAKNPISKGNNLRIKAYAAEYGFSFVDLYDDLVDPATDRLRESYTVDGAHLTPEGYAVFTKKIAAAIREVIKG